MRIACLTCIIVLLFFHLIEAEVPKTLSYQGILKDTDGKLVNDGTYTVNFHLYDSQTGGTAKWTEQQSVSVKNGIINAVLGSVTPINIPFDRQYWLGIAVGESEEFSPRLQLTSSPYSLGTLSLPDSSVTAGKIPSGQIVKSINNLKDDVSIEAGSNINITKSSLNNKLTISGNPGGLSLPYAGYCSSEDTAFRITSMGNGQAAAFGYIHDINNNSFDYSALSVFTDGSESAVEVKSKGTLYGGKFTIDNTSNYYDALFAKTNGKGSGIYALTTGPGNAGFFNINNNINSTYALSTSTNGSGTALYATDTGSGYGGWFEISNSDNSKDVIVSYNKGKGYSGYFYGSGSYSKGIYISVPSGNSGLYVSGGTKNALVATSQGARKLYTEESSEVWFTDYGFGQLQNGISTIAIDPLFSETVNLSEKYHVFIQSYGDADIYVSKRTPTQFEVRLREGDQNVEFSFRIVAKRKGYEQARLEHEPTGDDDPNLYPEKAGNAGAQKISSRSKYFQMQQELESQREKIENR